MDHLIYKLPIRLNIYDKNFIKELHKFYADEIICPMCDKNKLLEKLNELYSFEIVERKYVDYLFQGISIESIKNGDIWILHKTDQSSKFYKYYIQECQESTPIFFAYLDDRGIFVSNCSMFEVYISYLKGVDNIDMNNPEYKSYLNNLYLYNCCLKKIFNDVK